MNKHDELIERLKLARSMVAGLHDLATIDDAADLLQQYGDALVRLGDAVWLTDNWREGGKTNAEITTCELQARIEYAQTTVEGE